MTTFSKTFTSAAAAAIVTTAALASTPALAWKKSSDAALVNKMIQSLSHGSHSYKNNYRHKRSYGHKRKHRSYGYAPKHRYGSKRRYGHKHHYKHYAKRNHYKHYDRYDRGYVGYDGRFHTGFVNRYGWGKSSWIYKSRHVGHIDLEVFFHTGSAQLTHRAHRVLDSLGDALSYGKLRHSYFKIGGHTDAAGSYESNKYLSKRRAQVVKNYLVRHFDIASRRLVTVGYGEGRLAFPGHPYSKKNRRVEVSVISKATAYRIRNRHNNHAGYNNQY